MSRVVVVGGGIAAYCAALGARREGAEVTVIARAPGATALYAGAMEIAGDVEAMLRSEPHHPLARLGMDAVRISSEFDAAVPAVQLALERDGIRIEGTWRTRGLYADIHGLARPANLVPATVSAGELRGLSGKRVALVGVVQVSDFDAESTAQALRELHGIDAFAEEVDMPELPESAALTDLYGRRAPVPTSTRAALLAYPPGMTGLPDGAFELLASPPSPHGWRLQQAIGLGALRSTVVGFDSTGSLLTAARTGERALRADAFVLATGRYVGGGLEKTRTVREPLLDLAVHYQGRLASHVSARLRHLEYLDSSHAFLTGLMTDTRLRPVGEDGLAPVFGNLFAAGSVLGGYEYAGEYGFGVPLLTGWLAGRWAARYRAEAA